jgi:hypothetical protein
MAPTAPRVGLGVGQAPQDLGATARLAVCPQLSAGAKAVRLEVQFPHRAADERGFVVPIHLKSLPTQA